MCSVRYYAGTPLGVISMRGNWLFITTKSDTIKKELNFYKFMITVHKWELEYN